MAGTNARPCPDCKGVWRVPRQGSDGLSHQPRAYVPNGADACAALLPNLLERIENGDIDPSSVITHTAPLEKGPEVYRTFRDKKDSCIKVVLKPGMKETVHTLC